MNTIIYKGLEWYIINENEKEKLLFLKDCFTNEMIQKYFDKHNNNYDVQFNPDCKKVWWKDSYIKEILNGPFLNVLDKNDLNIMKTTLTLNKDISITEDYVRLITKEEVEKLQKINIEVLKIKGGYGCWTMSPGQFFNGSAHVFIALGANSPGQLYCNYVYNSYAIRPIISLKSDNLATQKNEIITMGYTLKQLENIKRLQKLHNI